MKRVTQPPNGFWDVLHLVVMTLILAMTAIFAHYMWELLYK